MKILDYISVENIFLDTRLKDKASVLRFIADASAGSDIVKNADALFKGLKKREQAMSTGVGDGIAFPHTTSPETDDAAIILIRLEKPIDFEALDKRPVDVILALIIPESNRDLHIRLLASISRLCKNSDFLNAFRRAQNPKTFWKNIKKIESEMAFH